MTSALWKSGIALGVVLAIGIAYGTASSESREMDIGHGVASFQELSDRFKELARKKGAIYAYDVLRRAPLPPNTDLHLLGHVVGEELYKQRGVAGIADCTQDFRNACSHAIVIGALNEFGGEKALALIRDACTKAPGGSGAYTMCYHGLGHGVFAYYGYDLQKTVAFCKKTGTAAYHDREYTECVGGAIMELMGGGGHDHDLWLAAQARYYDPNDPLAPCSSGVIPADAKGMCYVYITPHLFSAAGGDLALPQPEDFSAAFAYCDRISKTTPGLRQACFGGIGKEFPVLAMMRDVRSIESASDQQLQLIRSWCALAPHDEAYAACEGSVVSSLFWGGENSPDVSVRYCSLEEADRRDSCFEALFSEASQYLSASSSHASRLCEIVPHERADACRRALSL